MKTGPQGIVGPLAAIDITVFFRVLAYTMKKDAIDFCDYQILCAELSKLDAQEAAQKRESESEDRNKKGRRCSPFFENKEED